MYRPALVWHENVIRTMNLNERIRTTLKEIGGDLVGFADVADLPADMTGGLVGAVSIAVRLDPSVVSEISNGPTQRYYKEYGRVNELLGTLCKQIANMYQCLPLDAKIYFTRIGCFEVKNYGSAF